MGFFFFIVIVVVAIVVYTQTQKKPAPAPQPETWTVPQSFDDKVRFFTKVAADIGKINSEGTELFVGVDETESGSACFISMTLFDVEELSHAQSLFRLIKLPDPAIQWILSFSKEDDKEYYMYKETIQKKYPAGYFERIIRQACPSARFTNQLLPGSAGAIARFP